MPSNIVKAVSEYICAPLCYMFNLSFVSGCFPDCLKLAKVILLYKSENKELVTNYRPISVLPVFSKILEKLMHIRLYEFLDSNLLLMKINMGLDPNIPLTWHY